MFSILHRLVIEVEPSALIAAIVESAQLSAWWTKAEGHDGHVGFEFGPEGDHKVLMQVLEVSDACVRWQCVAGPWVETGEFVFKVDEDERGAVLHFAHHGWADNGDFYQHCNSKWGFFLVTSLKQYLETGRGLPHPHEPSI